MENYSKINTDNIQDITISSYRENFNLYEKASPSEIDAESKIWIDNFISLLPNNANIFEIGSATGRDARYFKSKGLDTTCADVIPEALQKLESEGFKTEVFDLRDQPKKDWEKYFDGFFANAVLLHIPKEIFKDTIYKIHSVLKENGVFAFSLQLGTGEEIRNNKINSPRFFQYYTEEELINLFNELPFQTIYIKITEDKKWIHLIVRSQNKDLY